MVIKGTRKLGELLEVSQKAVSKHIQKDDLGEWLLTKGYELLGVQELKSGFLFEIKEVSTIGIVSTYKEVSTSEEVSTIDKVSTSEVSTTEEVSTSEVSTTEEVSTSEEEPRLYHDSEGNLIAPPNDAPRGSLKLYLFTKYSDDNKQQEKKTPRKDFLDSITNIVKDVEKLREEEKEYYSSINKYL